MKNKTQPKKQKFDKYEQSIEEALNFDRLKIPSRSFAQHIRSAAKATLKENKMARANLRMNESDLEAIRVMAESSGMPYQTLINHIIHLYVTGQLIHAQEVKKLIDAGAFDRKQKKAKT